MRVERLRELNHLLRAAPEETLRAIAAVGDLTYLEQGRTLFRQDRLIGTVYFPLNAVVSILVGANDRSEIEMATVGNEGMVGIAAAIGVFRAFGRGLVQAAGEAVAVAVRPFRQILERDSAFTALLNRYLYLFVRQSMQSAACYRLHTPEERCARWLLTAQDRAQACSFPLTQGFIAEMMGTRRANVNAALGQFRSAGAIDYTYRQIAVLDRNLLESFACPCYRMLSDVERTLED